MKLHLHDFIHALELDEKKVMNLLQEHGVVSDLCIQATDVGNSQEAVQWLKEHRQTFKELR